MTIEEHIKQEFEHEHIIENLSKYELFYQISLANIVSQSEFDVQSTYKKINELSLDIDPETVFYTILAVIRHMDNTDNFEEKFTKELQRHASVHAIEDYIKNDKELIKPEIFLQNTLEKINENKFFTENMQKQFDSEYKISLNRWKQIIAKELSSEIRTKALEIL